MKNVHSATFGTTGTLVGNIFAKAVNTPLSTVSTDTGQGCVIKAFYLSFDSCGLGGTGVVNNIDVYIIKNPGNNLTDPSPNAVGTSNEKKYIFRQWHAMIMRNQDGNVPYHWEGWIKIPRRYQRMGTDDVLKIVAQNTSGVTGHFSYHVIYKWYT